MRRRGIRYLHGEGRGEIGDWPPEQSLLVFNLNERQAESVGRAWRQDAIVFLEAGRAAKLITLPFLGRYSEYPPD